MIAISRRQRRRDGALMESFVAAPINEVAALCRMGGVVVEEDIASVSWIG
jgi:hypothetical protein